MVDTRRIDPESAVWLNEHMLMMLKRHSTAACTVNDLLNSSRRRGAVSAARRHYVLDLYATVAFCRKKMLKGKPVLLFGPWESYKDVAGWRRLTGPVLARLANLDHTTLIRFGLSINALQRMFGET